MPSAHSTRMQALTSRLRARAPLLDWNQTCLHIRVINGVDHMRDHHFSRLLQLTKTGHFDAGHAGRRREFRRRCPQSAPRRLTRRPGRPGCVGARRPQGDDLRVVVSGRRPKRGTLTRDTPCAAVNSDDDAPKVPTTAHPAGHRTRVEKNRGKLGERKNPAVPNGTAGF